MVKNVNVAVAWLIKDKDNFLFPKMMNFLNL